ncbi:hypothetical protein LPJ61_003775 [Coemansia biformis]|uniref:Uncharacterized protein n=1 Tax=Coemansia biformis TaxID=1286918 RepID=A0A9W8CYA5_9FUNG|nr:hypothetical protein LPJ61_003775 [Coemansia biformis]
MVVVLEEDSFRASVDAIVERDFFPDLPRLQAENQSTPAVRTAGPAAASGVSLAEFLRTHVSEDSASFSRLLREENQQRGTGQSSTHGGPLRLQAGRQPRNALMFAPDGLSSVRQAAGERIVCRNTRMPEGAAAEDAEDAGSVFSDASTAGYRTPMLNGYKMVDPEELGRSGRTRFHIRPASARERAALRLAHAQPGPRGRLSSPGQTAASATPQRAAMLSPAAQQLLGRSSGRGVNLESLAARAGSDSLRRAYNSPYARRAG